MLGICNWNIANTWRELTDNSVNINLKLPQFTNIIILLLDFKLFVRHCFSVEVDLGQAGSRKLHSSLIWGAIMSGSFHHRPREPNESDTQLNKYKSITPCQCPLLALFNFSILTVDDKMPSRKALIFTQLYLHYKKVKHD